MKNKDVWLIIASIIILAGFITWGAIYNKRPTGINVLPMSVKDINQNDTFYKISAEYPQFNSVEAGFNAQIHDLITSRIEEFKKSSKENWDARRATATVEYPVPEYPEQPFDFQATWEPKQLNLQYISFVIKIYYFDGGAHGNDEIYAFNYDLTNRKEITINDFLDNSQDSLAKLSILSAQDIKSQLSSVGLKEDASLDSMVDQGTAPTSDNFKEFNFTNNSLIIYFQKYQVAPGAAGPITVTLYKQNLEQNSIKSSYLN